MLIDEEILKQVLSVNIKSARLKLNLTQDELAERSNISNAFLKDIESGRSGASLVTLINLCKALGTTPNDILRECFSDDHLNYTNLLQQITFLDDYEKNALYTLIQYFNTNHKDK